MKSSMTRADDPRTGTLRIQDCTPASYFDLLGITDVDFGDPASIPAPAQAEMPKLHAVLSVEF
jgi:hypothetical protein